MPPTRPRKVKYGTPRLAHVTCETADGLRWLKRVATASGVASLAPDGGLLIADEAQWATLLSASDGREI